MNELPPKELPSTFEQFSLVSCDTETSGLKWWEDKIFSLSLSWRDEHREIQKLAVDLREPNNLRWAQDVLPTIKTLGGFNLKFDLHFLYKAGIKVRLDAIRDAMVFAALLDEHRFAYDLDSIALEELGRRKVDIWADLADKFGGKATRDAQAPNMIHAAWDDIKSYMEVDAELPLLLLEKFWPKLHEPDHVGDTLMPVTMMEMELLPVLFDIERHGVEIDVPKAEAAVETISTIIEESQAEIDHMAGFKMNINSSKHMQKLLGFTTKDAPHAADGEPPIWEAPFNFRMAPAGKQPSIDADFLRTVPHPAGKKVLELRELKKMRDTFLLGHVLGHHRNGIVYPNYNQTRGDSEQFGGLGTISGRLSVNDPALQQIPKRNPRVASVVRALFIPDRGQRWRCRDYAQMDFRMMVHYARGKMLDQYLKAPELFVDAQGQPILNDGKPIYMAGPDLDAHAMVAYWMNLPRKKTPGIKGDAKTINLGLSFGLKAGGLAEQMELPFTREVGRGGREYLRAGEEALAIMEEYHRHFPGVQGILDKASSVARDRGFIKTILGRRTRFPKRSDAYKAGALLFQGSAAEANKVALIRCHKVLQGTDARILLNVHDEINSSMPDGEIGDKLSGQLKEAMETFDGNPFKFHVPIRTSEGIADNWWDASK